MKNAATLKSLLGLTQEEMGMLLGIPTSQWGMFKSGKRDLPLAALQQLSALITETNKAKPSKAIQQFLKAEQQKAQEKTKLEYLDLQLKLYRTEKEITTVENIRTECIAALEVATLLEKQNEKTDLAASIKHRATKTLNKHSLQKLEQLQRKKAMLEIMKSVLEK
ncbi:hypothetical protein [Flavobacterium sp.]|uniref:hypothetical protein n=1 Tax=Flavobacterium sp. TaxID=239 RepID=UPI0028BE57DB|nr:hypothetical protein [Flavobacterium sp.]